MTDLDKADAIMRLKSGQYIMASGKVDVTNATIGGVITIEMGDRLRVSCSTGLTMFALTEKGAESVAFGMREALMFNACHDVAKVTP